MQSNNHWVSKSNYGYIVCNETAAQVLISGGVSFLLIPPCFSNLVHRGLSMPVSFK